MIPQYLDSEDILPKMVMRPSEPFLVRPYFYSIVDGDTFRIRTPVLEDGKRHESFRIRLTSIDTPELRKPSLFDPVLAAGGYDPFRDGPGEMAREYLRKICERRVILVHPRLDDAGRAAQDRYGRMLAQVTISGIPSPLFRLNGAFSCEKALFDAGMAQVLEGETLPPAQPEILDQIGRSILKLKEANMAMESAPGL